MWIWVLVSITFGLDCNQKQAFAIGKSFYPFVLKDLPYKYEFLASVLPSKLVMLHHDTFQLEYANDLNTYISTTSQLNTTYLADLCLSAWANYPVQKYAGGLYNHYLYWWTLTATSCSSPMPTGQLLNAINQS